MKWGVTRRDGAARILTGMRAVRAESAPDGARPSARVFAARWRQSAQG